MPSDLTGYFGNKILRWINNQADMPARPTALYLAIFNGNPKTSGSEVGSSVNSSNPRQAITFANLASGVDHLLTSNIAADWGLSETDNVTISHYALFDASSGGNMYASRAINGGAQTIRQNSSVSFPSGQVTFNIGADS
jgi:hypothetical protein